MLVFRGRAKYFFVSHRKALRTPSARSDVTGATDPFQSTYYTILNLNLAGDVRVSLRLSTTRHPLRSIPHSNIVPCRISCRASQASPWHRVIPDHLRRNTNSCTMFIPESKHLPHGNRWSPYIHESTLGQSEVSRRI